MAANAVSNQKTIQQIIDSNSSSASSRKTGELGKDDFLNLLVTQLRYQDPLNPTDDKEFIGQMAQFSALEQMQGLNTSFSASKAFAMIGKHVVGSITDSENNSKGIEGEASNVKITSGKVYVEVNGEDVPVDNITDVSESSWSSGANLATYAKLIGYNVNGIAYDSSTGDMMKINGNVKSIQKGVTEDYAVLSGVSAEITEIVSDKKSTDPDYMKKTLEQAAKDYKDGKSDSEITVMIVDRTTGKKVPVTANISKLTITNGKYMAELNDLEVPVESITNITTPKTETTPQAGG